MQRLTAGRFRPNLAVEYIRVQLALEDTGSAVAWLASINAVFVAKDRKEIDCKATLAKITAESV